MLLIVALGILAGGVEVAVLWTRFERVTVDFPALDDGVDTWLLVGSDDRRNVPARGHAEAFGTPGAVPTRSADVLLLFQRNRDGRSRLIALNRDLVLSAGVVDGRPAVARLGPVLNDGEQAVVNLVCNGLGVAADHVVVVGFSALVELVDAVGGIDVTIEHPIRDVDSALLIERAGTHRLDGLTALAWVRSRFPEEFVNGSWVSTGFGTGERPERGSVIVAALAVRLSADASPVTLHRRTWSIAPGVVLDDQTTPGDLVRLLRDLPQRAGDPLVLPVRYGSLAPVPIARLLPEAEGILGAWRTTGEPCAVGVEAG